MAMFFAQVHNHLTCWFPNMLSVRLSGWHVLIKSVQDARVHKTLFLLVPMIQLRLHTMPKPSKTHVVLKISGLIAVVKYDLIYGALSTKKNATLWPALNIVLHFSLWGTKLARRLMFYIVFLCFCSETSEPQVLPHVWMSLCYFCSKPSDARVNTVTRV